MSETVNLPALGESVTEGTVTRWLKSVGDHVDVDEPLLEVSTDKVDTEIPSPLAGVLEEIFAQEDDTIDVGAPLAKVGDGSGASSSDAPAGETDHSAEESSSESSASDEQAETDVASEQSEPAESDAPAEPEKAAEDSRPEQPSEPEPAPEKPAAEPESSSTEPAQTSSAPAQAETVDVTGNAGYVTPLVRRLANQHGVDLSTVEGTGVGGRVRKEDVLDAASRSTDAAAAAPAAVSELRGTSQPMTRLRAVAAEQAVSSRQTTAQVTTVVEADVTPIVQLIERVQQEFTEKTGKALDVLPFYAKAATQALQEQPIINATVDGDQIVYPGAENLSVAVDTDRGLLSPVIKNASSLDVAGLATAIDDLAERTRSNSLTPDELSGGTFTIASSADRGALIETPLVFLPQSAALSVGAVVKRPVVVAGNGSDAIAVRSIAYLSLSYDQRIIDSTDASRFLAAVTNALENDDFEGQLGL